MLDIWRYTAYPVRPSAEKTRMTTVRMAGSRPMRRCSQVTSGERTKVSRTARQTGTRTACAQYSTPITRTQPANVIQLVSGREPSGMAAAVTAIAVPWMGLPSGPDRPSHAGLTVIEFRVAPRPDVENLTAAPTYRRRRTKVDEIHAHDARSTWHGRLAGAWLEAGGIEGAHQLHDAAQRGPRAIGRAGGSGRPRRARSGAALPRGLLDRRRREPGPRLSDCRARLVGPRARRRAARDSHRGAGGDGGSPADGLVARGFAELKFRATRTHVNPP